MNQKEFAAAILEFKSRGVRFTMHARGTGFWLRSYVSVFHGLPVEMVIVGGQRAEKEFGYVGKRWGIEDDTFEQLEQLVAELRRRFLNVPHCWACGAHPSDPLRGLQTVVWRGESGTGHADLCGLCQPLVHVLEVACGFELEVLC